MAYALVMTPEVRAWLHDLRKRDRASAIQVGQAIGMLLEAGPDLALPARRPYPPLPAHRSKLLRDNHLRRGLRGTVFSLSTGLAPFVKLTPASGEAGVAVTILGTDPWMGSNEVTFNGKPAQFKVVSSTEIQATVPAETSTGKVEVNTPQGALSSNVPFQVPLHPEMHHGRPLLKL